MLIVPQEQGALGDLEVLAAEALGDALEQLVEQLVQLLVADKLHDLLQLIQVQHCARTHRSHHTEQRAATRRTNGGRD